MATYLKRTSKLFDPSPSRATADVHLRDLLCPICRGILIEPVTLPCTHNLCLRCLKGTFEHNSLSCPLCRIRVGSWLRTATKSATLVNHELWQLIRAKFPKEIEDKDNGEERDLELDAGFTVARKLSAAGEIHREYEAQLQIAEEQMRRQRQAEQIASEALIQKIQAEEQQRLLAQFAQDQLLAKNLAKTQLLEKQKRETRYYNECLNTTVPNHALHSSRFNIKTVHNVKAPQDKATRLESTKISFPKIKDNTDPGQANMSLLSKIRAEQHSNVKTNIHKDSSIKYYCQREIPVYNAVTRTLKHQSGSKLIQPCTSSYSIKAECSATKKYATETKEELRIPSDVVNSKKKSLGVEVCIRLANDDTRIGSAESSGSHDSINQEIHHFKPIRSVPRTALKVASDGKHIDPKLIKVVPILKKMSNAVLKAPSPTCLKRIIGCSWSAFRGKARQNAMEKGNSYNLENTTVSIDEKPSTSFNYQQLVSDKLMKMNDTIRRLDFHPESSFDSNKNYAKNTDKLIDGSRTGKKLFLDDESEVGKINESWKTYAKNGMIIKSRRQRNACINRNKTELTSNTKNENNDNPKDSGSLFAKISSRNNDMRDGNDDAAIENIAERIKKRKMNLEEKSTSKSDIESDTCKRNLRNKRLPERRIRSPSVSHTLAPSQENDKLDSTTALRTKRQRACVISPKNLHESNLSTEMTNKKIPVPGLKKSRRNLNLAKSSPLKSNESDNIHDKLINKSNYSSGYHNKIEQCSSENNNAENVGSCISQHDDLDEDVIKEQQKIEQLVIQEREDFELACRLQAKFDVVEQIARRTTRRSTRKTLGDANVETNVCEIDTVTRTVNKSNSVSTAKRSIVNQTVSTGGKRRGRLSRRTK